MKPDGIWSQILRPEAAKRLRSRPALVLDRDGVLVEEVHYLHRPEEARLLPGAAEAVAEANRRRVAVVVVTNQSGIGRGLYRWPDFAATQERILADLAKAGAFLDMVLACPYHPEAEPPYRHADHPCRKPRPGMVLRAGQDLDLDLAASWIVGDRATDLAAGRAAGLAGGLHVPSVHGEQDRQAAKALGSERFEVRLGRSTGEALELPLLDVPV